MDNEMKIGALAPWFGSKRTLASRIIAEFGDHSCYWEPMCGSCAVLLPKPEVGMETVNDLHGGLAALCRCLANPRACLELYDMVRRAVPVERLWARSVAMVKSTTSDLTRPDPVWCAAYLYASWLARNGYGGSDSAFSGFAARFSATGGSTAARWRAVVDSIPSWHERLRNVTILNRDCFEVLSRVKDAHGTVIYVDPPYVVEGVRYDYAFTNEDHVRLSLALRRFRNARVVVSYYPHPIIARAYEGWTQLQIATPKFLAKAGQRETTGDCPQSPEILLINGPSYTPATRLYVE